MTGPIPDHKGHSSDQCPQTSDEFNGRALGPQWEWNHNPDNDHWTLRERSGFLRLKPMPASDLFHARNTLTQMTAKLDLTHIKDGDHTGLAMFEKNASGLEIVQEHGTRNLHFWQVSGSPDGNVTVVPIAESVQLRVRVQGDTANYFYSADEGNQFQPLGPSALLTFRWWKGSRPSIFAFTTGTSAGGFVDVDWVRYRKVD